MSSSEAAPSAASPDRQALAAGTWPPAEMRSRQLAPSGVLGMLIFLAAEAMLFAGLISSFLILRAGSGIWPPPGQPRLPVGITALNTLVLLASGYTMHLALVAARSGKRAPATRRLMLTGFLGSVFLLVQGTEWVRLIGYGLTASSSHYGATFYTLIGCHGVHLLAAVVVLLLVLRRTLREPDAGRAGIDIEVCRLYWLFVVALWPVLFVLVYLA